MLLFFGTTVYAQPYSPEQLAARLRLSTVVIRCLTKNNELALGTGFVIRGSLVATNAHVVRCCKTIVIRTSEDADDVSATIARVNNDRDVALLRTPPIKARPVILGTTKSIAPGTPILAVGHPRGLEYTVSDGIVSAIRVLDSGWRVIQITAPLSSGSSGGPIADRMGRVIGMSTMSFQEGQNLNFAVAVEDVAQLLHDEMNRLPSSATLRSNATKREVENLRRDVIRKMKESHAGARKLLALHEEEKQRVYDEYLQRRELYLRGLISRVEVAQAERVLATAILRVEEDKKWLAESELAIAEAETSIDKQERNDWNCE